MVVVRDCITQKFKGTENLPYTVLIKLKITFKMTKEKKSSKGIGYLLLYKS